jgi:glycosyltransferase involved in cell wall biosynthesis
MKISVVLNVLNEEKNIERALASIKWADEVVIVDDGSTDDTLNIAKKYTKLIYKHKSVGYVEPARNLAISKASGDWILIVDADEEIPETLVKRLQEVAEKMEQISFVEIPRKNLIFNKWMTASMWWPDYNIRFFKKGSVTWKNEIHSIPNVEGLGIKLDADEKFAIIHHNYSEGITQFIERLNRYTDIQAKELQKNGYKFNWIDLITKPTSEFLSRFFANRGFEDGVHGLALSLLQAFSFLIMYLKVWEMEKFKEQSIDLKDLKEVKNKMETEVNYWFKYGNLAKNPFKRFLQKAKNKVT